MRYRLLGNSGLRVSEAALGTMTFGDDWGWGSAKDEARKVYDAFREAGGNFIDTANLYTNGTSEALLGEFKAAAASFNFEFLWACQRFEKPASHQRTEGLRVAAREDIFIGAAAILHGGSETRVEFELSNKLLLLFPRQIFRFFGP